MHREYKVVSIIFDTRNKNQIILSFRFPFQIRNFNPISYRKRGIPYRRLKSTSFFKAISLTWPTFSIRFAWLNPAIWFSFSFRLFFGGQAAASFLRVSLLNDFSEITLRLCNRETSAHESYFWLVRLSTNPFLFLVDAAINVVFTVIWFGHSHLSREEIQP